MAKAFDTVTQKRLLNAIYRYARAKEELSWAGSRPIEERADLKQEYRRASRNIHQLVLRLDLPVLGD